MPTRRSPHSRGKRRRSRGGTRATTTSTRTRSSPRCSTRSRIVRIRWRYSNSLESETSGRVIVEHLVTMETARGDVRMRRIKRHLGDKIVNYAGTEEQRKRFGNKLLSIAMTEPGAGSDPSMIRGTARYDDATGEWILNAEKIYCSAFGASDGAFVFVRGPEKDGVRPFMGFVVEKGTPGLVELGQVRKMEIRSWDTADFVLQDCRVPAINKIDVDFKKTMIVFNGTRPGVAAMGLAIAGSASRIHARKAVR